MGVDFVARSSVFSAYKKTTWGKSSWWMLRRETGYAAGSMNFKGKTRDGNSMARNGTGSLLM